MSQSTRTITNGVEYSYGTEVEANVARRAMIVSGFSVSLIGYDSGRDVYAFDRYTATEHPTIAPAVQARFNRLAAGMPRHSRTHTNPSPVLAPTAPGPDPRPLRTLWVSRPLVFVVGDMVTGAVTYVPTFPTSTPTGARLMSTATAPVVLVSRSRFAPILGVTL